MIVVTAGLRDARTACDRARDLHARGEPFLCRFTVPPPRPVRVLRAAAEYLALDDPRERRAAIARLGVVEEIAPSVRASGDGPPGTRRALLAQIARLAQGAAACTHEEGRITDMLLEHALDVPLDTQLIAAAASPFVPARLERARRPDALVLWAPHEQAWIASLAVHALDRLTCPLIVVCRDGTLPNVRAEFVPPSEAAAALARARGVIDLSLHDPGEALALAALDIPLAVSYLSGAYEALAGVAIFRPWVEGDLAAAAAMLPNLGPARPRPAAGGGIRAARVHAFGAAEARRWAAGGDFERTTIVADANSALEALDCAARLRRAGTVFDLALALEDDPGATGLPVKATLRDLGALAETVVFRSWADLRRGFFRYELIRRDFTVRAVPDRRVPPPQPREPDGSIVVWAPDEPPERVAGVLSAARASGREVVIVDGAQDAARSAAALRRCALCIVPAPADPGSALALADWHLPLCAPLTSGAHEWLDGVTAYRPWSAAGMRAAVARALESPRPARRAALREAGAGGARALTSAQAVLAIVRSRGAARWEIATSAALAAQTHAHLLRTTVSSAAQARAALADSPATYVAFIDEGDVPYADCMARLAEALDRTGAAVAYGDALLGYVVPGRGEPMVLGYSVSERTPPAYARLIEQDVLVGTHFRVLFRRRSLLEAGGLAPELDDLAVADALARLCRDADAIWVDRVLGMSHRHLDGTAPAHRPCGLAQEYRRFYARHPVNDPDIAKLRTAVLERLSAYPAVALRPPPLRLHPPLPLFAPA